MRLIDADHLRRWILSRVFKTQLSVADVIDQIDREDTIEPQRKKGKWINVRNDNIAECDQCGITGRAWMNFCPICGARMEETNDSD